MPSDQSLKSRIGAGDRLLGTVINFPSPQIVEVAGSLGFDYVVLDTEHGPFGVSECEDMIRAADATGIPAVIRVLRNSPELILKCLDIGAAGVQIPHISTPEDAEAAASATYYHPRGRRSLAAPRAANYGVDLSLDQYVISANESVVLITQIEDVGAMRFLDAILSNPGIDLTFVGKVDLSQSVGLPGRIDAPAVLEAIEQIVATARRLGRPLATSVPSAAAAKAAFNSGFQVVTVVAMNLFAQAGRSYLKEVRDR